MLLLVISALVRTHRLPQHCMVCALRAGEFRSDREVSPTKRNKRGTRSPMRALCAAASTSTGINDKHWRGQQPFVRAYSGALV